MRAWAALNEATVRRRLTLHLNTPLAGHTTFRIGGPADFYVEAKTLEQLEALVEAGHADSMTVTVLGGGSNVLVADAGIRGLVIANQTRSWEIWPGDGEPGSERGNSGAESNDGEKLLFATSGMAMAGLARTAIRNGLTGLEWAVSVPGTVGGAVIGNAGAHGSDVAANLAWAKVHYPGRGTEVVSRDDMAYAYRTSALKRQLGDATTGSGGCGGPVVLAAAFLLQQGDAAEMRKRADEYLARRRATQPVEPSAGSIFRNPPGSYAGKLIEEVGLKGHRIGGAQISPRHANFIVNAGDASAADVMALINMARQRVWEATGLVLVPEILFIGEWATAPLLPL